MRSNTIQTTACALYVIHVKMVFVMSVAGLFIVVNFEAFLGQTTLQQVLQ